MDISISKPWVTVFLFRTARCLWYLQRTAGLVGKYGTICEQTTVKLKQPLSLGPWAHMAETKAYVFHPYPSITHKKVMSL